MGPLVSIHRVMLVFLTSSLALTLPCWTSRAPLTLPKSSRWGYSPTMGVFDQFKKAFENKDYSASPAKYEQTNARASHILVSSENEVRPICIVPRAISYKNL